MYFFFFFYLVAQARNLGQSFVTLCNEKQKKKNEKNIYVFVKKNVYINTNPFCLLKTWTFWQPWPYTAQGSLRVYDATLFTIFGIVCTFFSIVYFVFCFFFLLFCFFLFFSSFFFERKRVRRKTKKNKK
jgi:ABC-type multidrug transport system fused ATPase/permease subunit